MTNENTKHIRRAGRAGVDRRFAYQNGVTRRVVNRSGTLCGAEPTALDVDKKTAGIISEQATVARALACRPDRPLWVSSAIEDDASICSACRARAGTGTK